MKRRILLVIAFVTMLFGMGAPAADAAWACVVSDNPGAWLCLDNPLPSRLPTQ